MDLEIGLLILTAIMMISHLILTARRFKAMEEKLESTAEHSDKCMKRINGIQKRLDTSRPYRGVRE